MRVCPKCFSLYGPDQLVCNKDQAETQHHTEVLVGLSLGPYVVRSLVSEGGMGVVYAGEHPALGRRVALKVLRPELSLRDDIVDRFAQEARAVNTIGHDNIVNIYDFGTTPFGTFYIAMEFIEGRTLRSLLDAGGPQPLERVRLVVDSIGNALAAAHKKGFIHRDVKPENIMVGQRGSVEYIKLLDFGIAKLLTGGNTTATSSAMGTPRYMSPEQLDDAKVDNRGDIYAFGAVIYELLTGQTPYSGTSHAAIRQAQLTQRPQAPGLLRGDIHIAEAIDRAISRALALNPEDRFGSIDEFIDAFRIGHETSIAEQTLGVRRLAPRRPWKVFALTGVIAAALGVAIATTVLLLVPQRRPAQQRTGTTPAATRPPRADGAGGQPRSAQQSLEQALAVFKATLHTGNRNKALGFARVVAPERLRTLLNAELADPKGNRKAAEALAELPKNPSTIEALKNAARQGSPFARTAIAATLVRLGEKGEGQRILLEVLGRARNPLLRRMVLTELVPLQPRLAPALALLAKELSWAQMPEAKARTLASLARAGSPSAAKALRKTMRAAPWNHRLAATEAYLTLLPAKGLDLSPALAAMRATEGGVPAEAKIRVKGVLARHGDANASHFLVSSLDATEPSSRARAMLELGRLRRMGLLAQPTETAVAAKLARSMSHDKDTALAAATALLAF